MLSHTLCAANKRRGCECDARVSNTERVESSEGRLFMVSV